MIDTSGLVVMGVGLVSVMVVNLFVTKNNRNCPKSTMSLQAYSEPDDFPLPIPESIYGDSRNFVNVEPKVEKQDEVSKKEEVPNVTKHGQNQSRITLRSNTDIKKPTMAAVRSMSNPFLLKFDMPGTVAFHSTSKQHNLDLSLDKISQGDQTVMGSVPDDHKTDDSSSSEEMSQGDAISQDLPKDISSYSSSFSWEDSFFEREPFIEPVQDRQHQKQAY